MAHRAGNGAWYTGTEGASMDLRLGFLLAAATNVVGILLFSKGLTNEALFAADPDLFSKPGCALIIVWGLAYAALANSYREAATVALVFAIEKLFYGLHWLVWMGANAHHLPGMRQADLLAGTFYSVYGLVDLAFCAFFTAAWWTHR